MGMGGTPAAWLGFQEPHPQRKLTLFPLEATSCHQILSCGQGSCAHLSSMLDCELTWSWTGNHRCELVNSAVWSRRACFSAVFPTVALTLPLPPLLRRSLSPGRGAVCIIWTSICGWSSADSSSPLFDQVCGSALSAAQRDFSGEAERHTKEVHLMSQNTIPFGEPSGVCVFRHSAVVDGVFHTSGSRLWMLLFGSVIPSLISPYRFSLAAKTMNYW